MDIMIFLHLPFSSNNKVPFSTINEVNSCAAGAFRLGKCFLLQDEVEVPVPGESAGGLLTRERSSVQMSHLNPGGGLGELCLENVPS